MAKNFNVEILSNEEVAEKIYRLTFDSIELAETSRAGQFVQVKISDELTLRRPFAIAATNRGRVKIFYAVIGRGTEKLSRKCAGETLEILGGLGNGFSADSGKVLLVGGSLGLAPLLCAAEKFSANVIIGGKTYNEIAFWNEEFNSLVNKIFVTTDDGSYGRKGFVTDLLPEILTTEKYSAILTCGPDIMMHGVARIAHEKNIYCEVSLDKRMACGLGACLSCSIDTTDGRRKVCKDGPVFNAEKVFMDIGKKVG